MKANTNITLKNRRTLTLGNFKGVDFSSSPLSVRSDRASNMRNFINEYGVNKKRNGWNELLKIKHGGVAQRINGIFEYVNGDRREMLVHAGKRFYRLIKTDGKYSYEDITLSSTYTLLLERLSVSLPHPTNDCIHIAKTNNKEHSLFILYLMFFPIL